MRVEQWRGEGVEESAVTMPPDSNDIQKNGREWKEEKESEPPVECERALEK